MSRSVFERARKARPIRTISIEGLDEPIHIQPFGLMERLRFADFMQKIEAECGERERPFWVAAFVCAEAVVDEKGYKAFHDAEDAAKTLNELDDPSKPGALVFNIAQAILDASGLTQEAQDTAAKN